jgi:hypothetical protein
MKFTTILLLVLASANVNIASAQSIEQIAA